MGIRTDDHIARNCQTFFRQKCMLNTHLSDFKIIGDLVTISKLSDAFTMLSRFNIFIRHKMIRNKGDLILIKYTVHFHFAHFLDRNRAGNIISKYQIKVSFDQLTGFYLVKTRMRCKYFLCHCHTH